MRDHELRKRIRREKSQEQLPKATEAKINKLLEQLPEEPRGIKTRMPLFLQQYYHYQP